MSAQMVSEDCGTVHRAGCWCEPAGRAGHKPDWTLEPALQKAGQCPLLHGCEVAQDSLAAVVMQVEELQGPVIASLLVALPLLLCAGCCACLQCLCCGGRQHHHESLLMGEPGRAVAVFTSVEEKRSAETLLQRIGLAEIAYGLCIVCLAPNLGSFYFAFVLVLLALRGAVGVWYLLVFRRISPLAMKMAGGVRWVLMAAPCISLLGLLFLLDILSELGLWKAFKHFVFRSRWQWLPCEVESAVWRAYAMQTLGQLMFVWVLCKLRALTVRISQDRSIFWRVTGPWFAIELAAAVATVASLAVLAFNFVPFQAFSWKVIMAFLTLAASHIVLGAALLQATSSIMAHLRVPISRDEVELSSSVSRCAEEELD